MKRIFYLILSAYITLLIASCETIGDRGAHEVHWGYEGESGPNHWGDLKSAYALCGKGLEQSPINIVGLQHAEDFEEIIFFYKETSLKIIHNGHTVQVNYQPGSTARIGGKVYRLLQFHFHSPSEHEVDGNPYAMEMHLVHKSDDNKLAMVGVLMKKGESNPVLKKIWDHFPEELYKEKTLKSIKINVADLLPENRSYYHYGGSLTTPPCSEGVNWNVLKTSVEISDPQLTKFLSVIRRNARPVQPLNARKIVEIKLGSE